MSACLCCLGNTHLQPPNLLPYTGPVDGFPVCRHAGERRISFAGRGRHLLSFSLDGSASSLARIDQTDVGISSALPLALASSVLPMLRPLPAFFIAEQETYTAYIDGAAVGFSALSRGVDRMCLEHLWVLPQAMRRG